MGAELLSKMLPAVEKMNWTSKTAITEIGLKSYEVALEHVDSYKGDARVFRSALDVLQGCESRQLALAGVAYMLLAASEEKDGSYAPNGIEAAMHWLEKAQEVDPEALEVNFIEAYVYLYANQLENARMVLDYLHEQSTHFYRLIVAEAMYWQRVGELEEMAHWYEEAGKEAVTTPQKLRLYAKMADAYRVAGQLDKAVETYKKAIHFDKENAQLWHSLSLVYWKQENFEEAQRCNQQVLKLGADIPAAKKMAEELKKKLDQKGGGIMGKLFGRG